MLKAENIRFDCQAEVVLRGVSLIINPKDRIGLVGPNGVGKTTLLKVIAGELKPISGSIVNNGLLIGYLPQEITEHQELIAKDYVKKLTGLFDLEKEYDFLTTRAQEQSVERLGVVLEKLDHLGYYTFDGRFEKVLRKVGLSPVVLDQIVSTLSGGEKRRLLLAAILISQFDVVLLDEPTNDLDLEGIKILEGFLLRSKSTFLIVTHDRHLLRTITNKIADISPNGDSIDIYSLGYDEYVASREANRVSVAKEYEEYQEEKKRLKEVQKKLSKTSGRIAGNKASSDSEKLGRNAAREKASTKYGASAKAVSTRILKLNEPQKPQNVIDLSFAFMGTNGLVSETIVSLESATVVYDNKTIGPFNLRLKRRDKIVITGSNGSGKTTLNNLLGGLVKPTSGLVNQGSGVVTGIIDQAKTLPAPKKTLLENAKILAQVGGIDEPELRAILSKFNFGEDRMEQLASSLSPGERTRLLLVAIVARKTNFLLLDEPTNHLDIPAMEELEQAILSYPETIVLVTHDRELIEKINPTHMLEVKNGRLK